MADEGTASTLVLVAAIIQIIFVIIGAGLTGLIFLAIMLLGSIDPSMLPPDVFPPGFSMADFMSVMNVALIYGIILGIGTVVGFIFLILWLMWRRSPSEHKTGLIITGIIGLILGGGIPGLLALIGGAIAEKKEDLLPPSPARPSAPKEPAKPMAPSQFCHACGHPLTNPNAQFCDNCGASLT